MKKYYVIKKKIGRLTGDTEEPRGLQSMWSQRVGHKCTTNTLLSTVLLTKVQILFKSHKFYASVHYLFSYLFQDSTLHLIAWSSFSCTQHILVNSLFIFILLQIFSNFPCYGFLDIPIIYKWTFNFQIHGVFKVSLIIISHLDINFSLKCFLLCNPLLFFSVF